MRRIIVSMVAMILLFWRPTIHASEVGPEDGDRIAHEALTEWYIDAKVGLCFDRARLMMFGAHQREKGRPISIFVESGVLPADSDEYGFVSRGYEMSDLMDDAAKDYFLRCIKEKH